MKVLQINSVYGFGSTGKIVGSIHDYLLNHDVDSYVIYSRKEANNVNMKNTFRFYSGIGTAMHAFLALLFDTHGLHSKYNTKKIIAKIDEIDPDIVHLHNIHGFYLNYPMLFEYLKNKNKKVVWTLHDCWSYTGYCAYYDYNECYNWKKNRCQKCKYRNNYPYRFIISNSKRNISIKEKCYKDLDVTLVTPSQWLSNELDSSILKDKKHLVINNSVNLDSFYYEKNDLRNKYNLHNKTVVLAVANYWTNPKGYLEYLKLAKILDSNQQLVMIGLNDKQLNSLPKNIMGFKRMNIDELRAWYSSADVLLNLTLEDNYPTVNIEAKACGLPIITYRTGGSTEMVGTNGYVVDRYDLQTIKAIIDKNDFVRKIEILDNRMNENYLALYNKLYEE